MTRSVLAGLALSLWSACAAPASGPEAIFWTAEDLVRLQGTGKDLGGFTAEQLLTPEGAPLRWHSPPFGAQEEQQGSGDGLVVQPAFSEGDVAALVVFELWFAHPQPWVQPVWTFVTGGESPQPVPDVLNVFPVDVTGSFYSPFWQAITVTDPDAQPDTYRSAADVLNARRPMAPGPLVLCPITPSSVDLARVAGAAPVHPFTREAVRPATRREAWVDGRTVPYLALGVNRAPFEGDALVESPAWFFVAPRDGALSSLPPVLPPRAYQRSLMRRIDVTLPATAAVFVPADRPALAELVRAEGFEAPAADAAIAEAVARRYQLRVARDSRCFGDAANFPAGCQWLDSQAALEAALGPTAFERSQTQLAAAAVLAEGAARWGRSGWRRSSSRPSPAPRTAGARRRRWRCWTTRPTATRRPRARRPTCSG